MAHSPLDGSDSGKTDRTSLLRVLLWSAIALVLIIGLVLFFRYTRLMTPLL
jgi:hypothetical protein